MSWSAKIEVRNGTVEVASRWPQTGHGEAESNAAIDKAIEAAKSLVESGVVGNGEFQVWLSGHSNPDTKPSPGWARDSLTIQIQQI